MNSSPAVANGIVYIGSGDGKVYAFNATTGATALERHHRADAANSSPAVANGTLYVTSLFQLWAFGLP